MLFIPVQSARASLDTCNVDFSPHSVAPGSDTTFTPGLYNSNSNPVAWVRVTRPTGNYVTLESGNANGWSANMQTDTVTFTGGSLGNGFSQAFDVQALASNTVGGPMNWKFEASDDPSGAGAITCDGDMSLTIQNQPSVINISNVRVANVTPRSVTVLWDTDVASTSRVSYGLDGSYGSQSALNSNLTTAHSVALSGLVPNTGYHYAVTSTTPADGGTATSGDNTFITADEQAIANEGGIPAAGGTRVGGGVVTTPTGKPSETVPPVIELTTQLSGAYKVVPAISGTAHDNEAVAKVEYSVDGGKDWLPVDHINATATKATTGTGKNKKTITTTDARNVAFSFTPLIVGEGNYSVMARATDLSGNQAVTAAETLVIDRLPPQFGPSMVLIGQQAVEPDATGTFTLPVGTDYKMSVSMVGGPVAAMLRAQSGAEPGRSFSLTHSLEAGIWVGVLSFSQAGRYRLTGEAVDGAGNRTSRVLATVEVVPPVHVVGAEGSVKDAKVTLYYLNPENHLWTVWDGGAYGQRNPQTLPATGSFSLLAPAGTYYLKVAVPEAQDTITRSFVLDRPTPLTGTIRVRVFDAIKLGPFSLKLPWTALVDPPVRRLGTGGVPASVGKRLPLVTLPTTAGRTVSPVDWYGKPTAIVTMTTWVPGLSEQLAAVSELQPNTDINVVLLAPQQQAETVSAYLKISGRPLEAVADPDGLLGNTLTTPSIPVIYFVDRHGIIKKVMVGTRTADEILSALSHL